MNEKLKGELLSLAESMESLAEEIDQSSKDSERQTKTAAEQHRNFSLGDVGSVPGKTGNPLYDFLVS